jgi:hypothetical protein
MAMAIEVAAPDNGPCVFCMGLRPLSACCKARMMAQLPERKFV